MTEERKLVFDEFRNNPDEIASKFKDKDFMLPEEEKYKLMTFPQNDADKMEVKFY